MCSSLLRSGGLNLTLVGLMIAACNSSRASKSSFEERIAHINRQTGARQMSVARLKRLLHNSGERHRQLILLDVRETEETAASTLPGARAVPPSAVAQLNIAPQANAVIVAYCTVGYRSGLAAVALEKRLKQPVYNLEGGIIAWFNQGGILHDAQGQPTQGVHPYDKEWEPFLSPTARQQVLLEKAVPTSPGRKEAQP